MHSLKKYPENKSGETILPVYFEFQDIFKETEESIR